MLRRIFAFCCVLVALPVSATADQQPDAAEPSPRTRLIEDDLRQAVDQRRYLLVAVSRDDCPDCEKFETEALQIQTVRDWVDRFGILVRVNSNDPDAQEFVKAHQIFEFPTLLIMASDASELGRREGFTAASHLLTVIYAAINGEHIRGATMWEPWAGDDVVLGVMERAAKNTAGRLFEEALADYKWCLDHNAARSSIFVQKQLPKLITGLLHLAERYPPARKELSDRAMVAEHEIAQSRFKAFNFYVVKLAYEALGQPEKIIAFYDFLNRQTPEGSAVKAFRRIIFEHLLNADRYKDIRYAVEDPDEIDQYEEQWGEKGPNKNEVRLLYSTRYRIFLGLGKDSEATEIANRLISIDPGAQTYQALAEAGFDSGRFTDEILQYARAAHRMTGGLDAKAVMVLARLLARQSPNSPEAIRIINKGIEQAATENSKKALQECLAEIDAPPETKKRDVTPTELLRDRNE